MNPKKTISAALTGAALVAISTGIAIRYSAIPAKAAPLVKPPLGAQSITPAPSPPFMSPGPVGHARVSDLLDGKLFPLTLKSEQLDSAYHMVVLIDLLDKSGTYVTKGDTTVFGGETYLVTYNVPLTSGLAHPAQPKPDSVAQLILIDMRAIQAITAITPILPISQTDQTEPEKPVK